MSRKGFLIFEKKRLILIYKSFNFFDSNIHSNNLETITNININNNSIKKQTQKKKKKKKTKNYYNNIDDDYDDYPEEYDNADYYNITGNNLKEDLDSVGNGRKHVGGEYGEEGDDDDDDNDDDEEGDFFKKYKNEEIIFSCKWSTKDFKLFIDRNDLNCLYFFNLKNSNFTMITAKNLEMKRIIIYLYLLFNQFDTKSIIGRNPIVNYIDYENIDTSVLPEPLTPKKNISLKLSSWKKIIDRYRSNNQNNLEAPLTYSNKYLSFEKQLDLIKMGLGYYWSNSGVTFLVSVVVARQFPLASGFIKINKNSIQLGIGNSKTLFTFPIDKHLQIKNLNNKDPKLISIIGRKFKNKKSFYSIFGNQNIPN